MKKKYKRIVIAFLIQFFGIAIAFYPVILKRHGEEESKQLMEDFKENVKDTNIPEEETTTEEHKGEQATSTEAQPDTLQDDDIIGVIGIIKIEAIGIEYPIIEGCDDYALNRGIGHLPETSAIGTMGNCVLCGHNGSRRGTFFTPLNTVSIGDMVEIMDKSSEIHKYKIVNTRIVGPTDNSIKDTDDTEKLTLFTCANRGSERFVCDCLPVND